MTHIPDYNENATKTAWQHYIRDKHALPQDIPGVRPLIVASWARSCQKGFHFPQDGLLPCLPPEKLRQLIRENDLLIRVAYPYLQDFYRLIQDAHHQITLADKHGYQLRRIGSLPVTDAAADAPEGFQDGTDFSEAALGTNGIGTALACQQPVMILGAEHLHPLYHEMACYAAPLYTPAGKLLGCLNITGPLADWNPMIMGVLQMAVNGIQEQLRLIEQNHMLDTLVESFGQGVLILNQDQRIRFINQAARTLLRTGTGDLTGCSIYDIIARAPLPDALKDFRVRLQDEDMTLYDRQQQPIELSLTVVPSTSAAQGLDNTLLLMRSQTAVHTLTNKLAGFSARCDFESIVGRSAAIQSVISMGKLAAGKSTPVLLFGEEGTEKHILAQAIHQAGAASDSPFVELNCAATPSQNLSAELFGREDPRTGARIPGRLQLAQDGTLYLDDIDALPVVLQERLVLFLKGEGGPMTVPHCRILASTSRNLFSRIQQGLFREDLYYLLTSLTITIPPLRERQEDIPVIAARFASQRRGRPVKIQEEAAQALCAYPWSGNTRQLEEMMELALQASTADTITLANLPDPVCHHYYAQERAEQRPQEQAPLTAEQGRHLVEDAAGVPLSAAGAREYYRLTQALKKANGHVSQAAELLQMPASTVYRRLSKLHIRAKDFRSR